MTDKKKALNHYPVKLTDRQICAVKAVFAIMDRSVPGGLMGALKRSGAAFVLNDDELSELIAKLELTPEERDIWALRI